MKSVQVTIRQLFRSSLILACSLFTTHTIHSQSVYSQPYTFTTLAGQALLSGSADGAGSAARFDYPFDVAVDSAGTVYVADADNNTIRKITAGGVVSTLAGVPGYSGSADGVGSSARFDYPLGAAVDGAGNIYVADADNHTIRKVTPAGVVSTVAGGPGVSGSADGKGADARFNSPTGVAVDGAGNVYVADTFNNTIRKITPAGVVSTVAGLAGSSGSADGTGNNARFNGPGDVAVDRTGNIYVADSFNSTIRKITPGGAVSTVAGLAGSSGSADGMGSEARFNWPGGVAVDGAGRIYVADAFNSTIRKITPAGVVSTLAGLAEVNGSADGTGSNARFYWPGGVAVDGAGNVYVADPQNSTIRVGRAAQGPPLLSFSFSNNQFILSWPLTGSNFVVEASSGLSPGNQWTLVTNAVGANGGSFLLTNSVEGGARFFRLR